MARLEDLDRGATIRGLLPANLTARVAVKWPGTEIVELTSKDIASQKSFSQAILGRDLGIRRFFPYVSSPNRLIPAKTFPEVYTTGHRHNPLVFRDNEPILVMVTEGRPWPFDPAGELLRLRLAHRFAPSLAIYISLVEPLPHQNTTVYDPMLPRRPLRFLLPGDPGAGKTIISGLPP